MGRRLPLTRNPVQASAWPPLGTFLLPLCHSSPLGATKHSHGLPFCVTGFTEGLETMVGDSGTGHASLFPKLTSCPTEESLRLADLPFQSRPPARVLVPTPESPLPLLPSPAYLLPTSSERNWESPPFAPNFSLKLFLVSTFTTESTINISF